MERLIGVIRDGLYSRNFSNLRLSDNRRLPVALLKVLRNIAKPPLVIDLVPTNRPLALD